MVDYAADTIVAALVRLDAFNRWVTTTAIQNDVGGQRLTSSQVRAGLQALLNSGDIERAGNRDVYRFILVTREQGKRLQDTEQRPWIERPSPREGDAGVIRMLAEIENPLQMIQVLVEHSYAFRPPIVDETLPDLPIVEDTPLAQAMRKHALRLLRQHGIETH